MSTPAPRAQLGWLERFAPLGAIVFGVWLAIAFLMSPDNGETSESVLRSARDHEGENIVAQILALAAPILIGWFLAGLLARMRPLADSLARTLTLVGGTLFVAFFSVAITLWTAPLLDHDSLSATQAEAYLAFDDVGWVLLGTAGVAAGVMIIGASLAALRLGWGPRWLGIVSLLLGVASFATIAFVGMFAWIAWLIVAGVLLLVWGDRTRDDAGVAHPA